MFDKKVTPIIEKKLKMLDSEIEDMSYSFFKKHYTSSADTTVIIDNVVAETVLYFKRKNVVEVERRDIEEIVSKLLNNAIDLKEKEIIFIEDEERDFEDVQYVLDELGVKVFNNESYKSIKKITVSEIDKIRKRDSIINTAITDILDSTFTEYPPKRLIREIQVIPYNNLPFEDKKEADIWIDIAKDNLSAIANVAEKFESQHIIMITKIAKDYLCEIINRVYDDKNCAECITVLFNGASRDAVIKSIISSRKLKLFESKKITLLSKPYYDENASESINNQNTALKTNIDEYDAELHEFQNELKETLFDVLIKRI